MPDGRGPAGVPAPILAGPPAAGGVSIEDPEAYTGGNPVGGPSSRFNRGGAPIAVLGGVFSGGLPLGGPVTQIFRGGSAPTPPTLFINTLTPSGPIQAPFIGSGGAPIGVAVFGGGGLPISAPPAAQELAASLQPPTAQVAASVAEAIGAAPAVGGGSPIGGGSFR